MWCSFQVQIRPCSHEILQFIELKLSSRRKSDDLTTTQLFEQASEFEYKVFAVFLSRLQSASVQFLELKCTTECGPWRTSENEKEIRSESFEIFG